MIGWAMKKGSDEIARRVTNQDLIEQLSAENRYLRQQIEELRRSYDRLAALTWVQPPIIPKPTGWD